MKKRRWSKTIKQANKELDSLQHYLEQGFKTFVQQLSVSSKTLNHVAWPKFHAKYPLENKLPNLKLDIELMAEVKSAPAYQQLKIPPVPNLSSKDLNAKPKSI